MVDSGITELNKYVVASEYPNLISRNDTMSSMESAFMFQNIDVLNGIAWDEGNHRLFGEFYAVVCFCPRCTSHNKWPWNLKDVMSLFGAEFAVTGKLWPKLYEIKLRPVDGPADGSVEKLCPKASFYR